MCFAYNTMLTTVGPIIGGMYQRTTVIMIESDNHDELETGVASCYELGYVAPACSIITINWDPSPYPVAASISRELA